ncbi:MAG: hypothetical protein KY458_05435 [Actinobacteria bacterium]|nr:hypothetical protein [Actinomycetota bacterium]
MPDNSLVRRVLWAFTALCLAGALLAIPLVDGAGDGSTTSSTTRSGATGATGTPSTGAPSAGAGTAARSGGASLDVPLSPGSPLAPPATKAPAEDLGPPEDPGPAVPPRPGTYRYRYRQAGQETTSLTRVEDRGRAGDEVRQVVTRQGGGLDATSELSWRPDGAYVTKTVFTFGAESRSCDWEPDVLRTRLPLAAGVSWEARSRCTMDGIGGTPLVLGYQSTGRVTELHRVRVAGRTLDVWVLEETERFDFGGRTVDNASTTFVSPRHGVIVKSTTRTRDSAAGDSSYELELVNLDPE